MKNLTKSQLQEFLLSIIAYVDYDLSKDFDKETAEEPEYVDEKLKDLVSYAQKQLIKISKK